MYLLAGDILLYYELINKDRYFNIRLLCMHNNGFVFLSFRKYGTMYIKEFEIRWNDIDANRHLANRAYVEYATHVRMSYLSKQGFNQQLMSKFNIGPVVFYEHIYYFKEVFYGRPVRVSMELSGVSEDGKFFEFRHNYYDHKGRNFAHCEMMGGWVDLKERKLISLPEELNHFFNKIERPKNFKILTQEDTRRYAKTPVDLAEV